MSDNIKIRYNNLHAGMTLKDAEGTKNPKTIRNFRFTDKNYDGVLSPKEIIDKRNQGANIISIFNGLWALVGGISLSGLFSKNASKTTKILNGFLLGLSTFLYFDGLKTVSMLHKFSDIMYKSLIDEQQADPSKLNKTA